MRTTFAAAGMLLLGSTAQAALLWEQPLGGPVPGTHDTIADNYYNRAYDDFHVASNWTLTGGAFWTYEWSDAGTNAFEIEALLFNHNTGNDSVGALAHQLHATGTRVQVPDLNFYYPEYTTSWLYEFTFDTPVNLNAGDDFWVSFRILDPGTTEQWAGFQPCQGACSLYSPEAGPDEPWGANWPVGSSFEHPLEYGESDSYDLAFQLTGTAAPLPEPGTLGLLGLGFVGLGLAARRRRSV